MWFGPSLMMGAKNFATFSTLYTTNQTVTPPIGALFADIECIGGGGAGLYNFGGQGGNYAFQTVLLNGVDLQIFIGPGGTSGDGSSTAVVRSATTLCSAQGGFAGGGRNTSPGVGTINRYGGIGLGPTSSPAEKYGGGAAGPSSNGGDAQDYGGGLGDPGASGGYPAGAGEALYGGGGRGGSGQAAGRDGCVRITWRG